MNNTTQSIAACAIAAGAAADLIKNLQARAIMEYDSPVTSSKEVTGLGGLNGAVINRLTCKGESGFLTSDAPITAARTGEPQGSPVLHRSANPVSGCHPLGGGMAVSANETGASIMTTVTTITTTDTTSLVPVFTGTLQGQTVQLCDARTLHAFMAVLRDFSDWIKSRIRKFEFVSGVDFIAISRSPEKGSGNRGASVDYHLTLDMAKELSMVENNAKGREARRYFMECEKQVLAALSAHPTDRIAYSVNPTDTLTASQAEQIRLIFKDKCDTLPRTEQGAFMSKAWSKLKSHFGCTYRKIEQREFSEALSLATRHAAEWQAVGVVVAAPIKNALKALPASQVTKTMQLMVVTTEGGRSTVEMFPAEALPEIILQTNSPIDTDLAQKVASRANMRMMGEVMQMCVDHEFEERRRQNRKLSAHQLKILTEDGYLELTQRTILGNEMGGA